ncbi:phage protein [Marinibactrum halimedae]|uniref:Tail protein n=1 Tax=Marinibactrum halimedae TaxID=1444977 RepID=A0AA37T3B3_9GAMM|nr:phage protein [Marinibactrum halimedae]MCD9458462.1 DUF2597 family protein [Marinibactrum halimedae]GLS26159.1 tail protein [Marinibactrum halimedae]
MKRMTGKNFDVMMGDFLIHVQEASLDIDDQSTVAKTKGIPDGQLDGEVGASGSITVNTQNFKKIVEVAKSAGAWRAIEPFDMNFTGNSGSEELSVLAHDCQLRIASLIDIDSSGGEAHTHTLDYDVTGPDFVHIDGVPYLRPDEIRDLT